MKSRLLIFGLFIIVLLAASTLLTLMFNTPPERLSLILAFYSAYFTFLTGLLFLFLVGLSYYHYNDRPPFGALLVNLRFSVLAGALASFLLLLQASRLLNWPSAIVLIVGALVVELLLRRKAGVRRR